MDTTDSALGRARAGDEDAFRELVDPYRRELQLHCYRILGSLQDAEDAVQETLLAAWRGLDGFEGRASLRAWLYRIATNRCLNALRGRGRRPQGVPSMVEPPEPTRMAEPMWLEPYPDALLDGIADDRPGPDARYETTESVGLAFVAALQRLPPRQRAAVVLRDVLGFERSEVADMLGSTDASVKGALQRARATLDERLPAGGREGAPLPSSARERELAGIFASAVERGDTEGVISLLTDDAWLTMPPEPYEYQGGRAIARFLDDRAARRGASLRLVPTRANRQPAFGCYLPDPQTPVARAFGLMVITLGDERISKITWFTERSLFARFGLPRTLAS
ncbi:MAG TPA: sigma-70 family RNA polymerase sigma factor [Solirubrobacteraceae bacterium]|jgi:RNA polymerase sigma-70 factor (ECF subfamily)|nr:sigma-70 family RNA polymerase sigma factor [Solirubrobacteraceae bacterium]